MDHVSTLNKAIIMVLKGEEEWITTGLCAYIYCNIMSSCHFIVCNDMLVKLGSVRALDILDKRRKTKIMP